MIDCQNSKLCHIIDEYINGRNAERNRKILKRRLIDGVNFESLAEEFGMSVRQCKRIVYILTDRILKYI